MFDEKTTDKLCASQTRRAKEGQRRTFDVELRGQHGETVGVEKQTEISDEAEESGEFKKVTLVERLSECVRCSQIFDEICCETGKEEK